LPGFLEHVTVVDLATVGPAARCSRILADYGARVIKVAPPPKRGGAQVEPPLHSYGAGRGFERIRIDLKAPGGRAVLLRLIERADAFLESFRPGVAARLGLGYEELRARNPRLVYCSTSGYGQDGPHAGRAGHDLDYLAVGGFLHCSSRRADGAPAIPGATVAAGAAGGMHAAVAILAALAARERTGEGTYLDVSVADGVLHLMALHVDEYLATGVEPGPGTSILTGRYACYDVYRTRDGKWLAVAAIEPAFFANLCRALGLEKWIERQTDDDCQEAIREDLRRAFARKDRDAWIAELAGADTCVAPVYSIPELVEDPQFAHRGVFVEAEHPDWGRFRQVGPVLAGCERPAAPHVVRTETNARALLEELGYANDEIRRLLEAGIVA